MKLSYRLPGMLLYLLRLVMLVESKMELFTSTRALYNMCCVSAVVVSVVFVHIENRPGLSVQQHFQVS